MLGCCLLMMYYTTVTGWMVDYFYKFLRGDFVAGMGTEEIGGVFSQMLSSPGEMTIFMVIVVVLGFLVCSFGVQKGLERITKVMMIALLVIMVVLAVNSLSALIDRTEEQLYRLLHRLPSGKGKEAAE